MPTIFWLIPASVISAAFILAMYLMTKDRHSCDRYIENPFDRDTVDMFLSLTEEDKHKIKILVESFYHDRD